MNVIRASLAALLLVSLTYCADQYEKGSHGGATDPVSDRPFPSLFKTQQLTSQKDGHEIRRRAVEEFQRKRRGYYEWPASVVAAPAVWQPAAYQIQRPYFIPVWGGPGRVPIYFPPQPILFDDPRKGYLPPRGYLPPDPRMTTMAPSGDGVTFESRVGEDSDDDADRPVWGVDPPAITQSPLRTTTQSGVPTRRTRRPGVTAFPPLVHPILNNTASGNASGSNNGRPMALRPSQELPILAPPLTTRAPSQTTTTQRSGRQEPSRCVWAIISCCTAASQNISYSCFEQLGCTGAFWDTSPCDSDFARAAIEVASKYYGGSK